MFTNRVEQLAKLIDHGILSPTQTDEMLREEIELAKKYKVASVCVKPYAVSLAVEMLEGSGVEVGTVVGFPHGSNSIAVKVFETAQALCDGAVEIDMVVNIGKVISEDWQYVEDEIASVLQTCKENNAILKVIFENTYLKDFHKLRLCSICSKLGVDYVKTSTGFDFLKDANGTITTIGATIPDCELMSANISSDVKVKAAGGIRNLQQVEALVQTGVARIGTSATATILKEALL